MQQDSTTILITGSTGNIGSELTRQLANFSSRLNLKAVVRSADTTTTNINNDGNSKNNKARLQYVVMDFDRPETMVEGLENVDKLFLLTPTHPKLVEFTSNIVNEAKKTGGIKHIVKLSHIRADAAAGAKITITNLHREAEKVIEESGISYTFLRPNFFFQNFINFYGPMIKSQGSFSLPAGDGKVSFVDVRDIASVAATVLTKEEDDDGKKYKDKAYDVTGPESLTYSEAANILSNEVGKKIGYSNISEDDARQMIKAMGMNDWHTNVLLELLRITREGYLSNVSSAIEEVTGNKPIPFQQFTKDYASAFR
ncbi:MAG TPA: NmrA family NAD(P)-binding protein [Nitrososphaera sp.]|nr:NmrA family NAD(P)-binding protein [Nitrososphaera sp.]